MATITARHRKDGTTAYTAQIKIKRGGKFVFTTAQTFDKEKQAREWARRKEAELARPGALDTALRPSDTLDDALDRYLKAVGDKIGRTKAQVLGSLRKDDLAALPCAEITSREIVALAERLGATRKPQTVMNYLSHLSAVFALAHDAWGMPLEPAEMQKAMRALKRLGAISKSSKRDRRPTVDEMEKLMEYFAAMYARGRSLPMHKVITFAMFSTRRQEEILRIQWADLETGRVLVRDMKHPGEKIGNNQWVELPPEAESVAATMPKVKPEIFPYSTDAVSAAFTRACRFLAIEDLHFHDLRHEGVSRLFEMGRTIPQAASVSGHRSWQSLQRYTHLRATGDKWAGWSWMAKLH